jgi:peptide/nickel transport system substrate-binding protein
MSRRPVSLLLLLIAASCSRGHSRPALPDAQAAVASALACPPAPAPLRFDPSAPPLSRPMPSARGMVVQLDAEPATLLPLLRPDWMSWTIVGHLVDESLVRVDPRTGSLLPELAERWEVDDAHERWTFHLRHDVMWHDGVALSADDVVFTFERLLAPDVGAADRGLFAGAHVTKTGPYDVEVKLRTPLASAALDFDRVLILPRHRFPRGDLSRSPDANAPVGTGPMRFVSWARGMQIVLARNDHYWGPPAPLASLTFRFLESRPAIVASLERGEMDLVPRAPVELADRIEKDPAIAKDYVVMRSASFDYTAWIHNVVSPKLADPRVRRAIGLAIPREALRTEVERCSVTLALGPLPVGHPALASLSPPPFDPEEAAHLLDEAGLIDANGDGKRDRAGAPFTLTLLYPASSREQERAASVVADELRRLGVTLELLPLEWAQFLHRIEAHDFELAAIQWSIDAEPDLFPLLHSTQVAGSLNYGGYADHDVDGWLEELRSEEPPSKRVELLTEVVQRVRRDEPYTYLFSPLTLAVVRRGAHGVQPTALGWEPRAWGWD